MRTSRRRIGPDEAERLLGRVRDPAYPELSRLLAAASAPPRPRELAGLDGAVAAFEAAVRMPRPVAPSRRRRLVRPLAAVAAAVAMLAGGVAVAAETGHLPGSGGQPPGGQIGTPWTASPGARATPDPAASGTPATSPAPGGQGTTLSPSSPAVAGLCRAWDAQRRNPNGAPMAAEALRDLAAAAGREDRIPAFCAPVLAAGGGAATPSHPGVIPPTPSHPAGKGQGKPTPSPDKRD